jgi:hypothetical protein
LRNVTRFLFFVPLTAAIIALTFLAMGLERPLLIESAVHAFAGQLTIGAQPGRVNLAGGGGGGGKDAVATSPPLSPAARYSWFRGDSNGIPGVQILTGCPPNNWVLTPGLTAGEATKLTILEVAEKPCVERERERVNRRLWE